MGLKLLFTFEMTHKVFFKLPFVKMQFGNWNKIRHTVKRRKTGHNKKSHFLTFKTFPLRKGID